MGGKSVHVKSWEKVSTARRRSQSHVGVFDVDVSAEL